MNDHSLNNEEKIKDIKYNDTKTFNIDNYDGSYTPHNSKGGILITEEQIEQAFDFFDIDKKGKITIDNLRSRLGIFYKSMSTRDYKFLMNNENIITMDDLKKILIDNEIIDFDPIQEAFKTYDIDNIGYITPRILSTIFEGLGLGKLTPEDMNIILNAADLDKDGKISLQDFRKIVYKSLEG